MRNGIKIFKRMRDAGWLPAVGDALRGMGKALGVAMLSPQAPAFRRPAGRMFRMVVGARVTRLEVRAHNTPTGRCSRGSWRKLDTADTPRNAAGWAKLADFWAWYAAEIADGRTPRYSWTDDRGKDHNRCHTRVNANRPDPSRVGGPGRGSKGKANPTRAECFGHSPATGKRIAQTHADVAAERRHRQRIARRERMALQREAR